MCDFSGDVDQLPEYIAHRNTIWYRLKKEFDNWVQKQERKAIKITLPDGSVKVGEAWETTPYSIAVNISRGLADATVVAKVNGELWDLNRPFEGDAELKLLKFDDPEGQYVFWHSSAHMLGEAMEQHYGGCLCYGPPVEGGFYYDMFMDERSVSQTEFQQLESLIKLITKEKQKFERLEIKKEDLLEMFSYNKFKVRLLNERVKTATTTVYKSVLCT